MTREERIGFIPDGWFEQIAIGESGPTLVCVEIEDSNPLTPEKLWRYCDLWDTLDFYDCDLRLLVFDRYGENERELNLGAFYIAGLVVAA